MYYFYDILGLYDFYRVAIVDNRKIIVLPILFRRHIVEKY